MIIDIRDDLFYKLLDLMKNRNSTIYNELKEIKPLDTFTTDTTLQQAREIRTQKIKESIKETIQKLLSQDIQPTKYKINKKTGIANVTINKYYDDILKEVKNGNE
ncbi:hypothetical protein N5T82_02750 [Aliarcobacter cryaerophilus]|uniref:hypothetical protein n=1 Tax=Aliarcobacter cryaerophilus TaxID=28198 RepID=UPI0021B4EB44|nr:hypothetical protein [Aliarcobacter cryaerophilus]MCT7538764.1 hypothetical protein [Aliarcobacter cryaerophilus]